jgi:hypothetical protein
MTHVVVLGMLLAGFACLSLSMTRHQLDVLRRPLSPFRGRLLRGFGFLLIAAGLPVAIDAFGGGVGTLAWFGYMAPAAGAIFLSLSWRRQRMP